MINFAYQPMSYEHDYFDKEYKAQYGKAYTADRQSILMRSQERYAKVRHLFTATTHPQLLEIGSAAGYFLQAMQNENFAVRGWEISRTMTDFANARGIKTIRQDFIKGARAHEKKKTKPFDVVALFYVLEHIEPQREAWQHLAKLVRSGGFLLLALPSSTGPTFRFNRNQWFATHPTDHYVDYSPQSLKLLGAQFGFQLRATFSEGIHPQRFPGGKFKPLAWLYEKALLNAPLSDTIFAVLERHI